MNVNINYKQLFVSDSDITYSTKSFSIDSACSDKAKMFNSISILSPS